MIVPARPPLDVSLDFLLSRITQTDEAISTSARPLGAWELGHTLGRQNRGINDFYILVTLDLNGTNRLIEDEDVLLAGAVIRLRHPTLASRIVFTGAVPEIVCFRPITHSHAVEEAKAATRISTFHDQRHAFFAMQDWFLSTDPCDAFDVRQVTSRLHWLKGTGTASGQYVLGVQSTYFVADARSIFTVMRQFLNLVCEPGRSRAELDSHFAKPLEPPRLPRSIETAIPEAPRSDIMQIVKAHRLYQSLLDAASKPRLGLMPDGTSAVEKYELRTILHSWSTTQSASILKSCQRHGATVTHLAVAATTIASMRDRSHTNVGTETTASPESSYAYMIHSAMDLAHRLSPSASLDELETAARLGTVPTFLQIPSRDQDKVAAIWKMAQQCKDQSNAFLKSPHFWQLIMLARRFLVQYVQDCLDCKPVLPVISSVGDCSHLLPPSYHIVTGQTNAGELRVTDLSFTGKVPYPAIHVWAYHGRLHLHLTYNNSHFSRALMEPYFHRVVELITAADVDSGKPHQHKL